MYNGMNLDSEAIFEAYKNEAAPIVVVVILTRVSRASSKLLVFARSVVTCSSMSENLAVLLDFGCEGFSFFCSLSCMGIF